jgi:polyisoprenoid-binding protein YceI
MAPGRNHGSERPLPINVSRIIPAITGPEMSMAWQYDPNLSKVEWAIDYLGIATVKGRFTEVHLEALDKTQWSVAATINAASITGGHAPMDDHVRSPDFLDVERYPTITFRSRRVEETNDRYCITGDLTLHGVTREVTLDATYGGQASDTRGRAKRGFHAQTTITRTEFGMAGGRLVAGDQIRVTLDIIASQVD